MSSSDDDKKTGYEIGYGRPPKATQWKPGQSGNPSGKKTKDETFLEKVRRIATKEIVVNMGGQPQAMQNEDAAIHAFFAKVHTGHPQAFKLLIELRSKDAGAVVGSPSLKMTEADLKVLEATADWYALLETARAEMQSDHPDQDNSGGLDDGDAPESF